MELEYLREYATLVKFGSFTKAAAAMFMTQPTLSKHMALLEQSLECELLVRGQLSTAPTPIGKVFLQDSLKVVAAFEEMMANVEKLKGQTARTVKVLVFPNDKLGNDLLAATRVRLLEEYPLLEIEDVDPDPDTPPCVAVARGDADAYIGLSCARRENADIRMYPLFSDPETAVVHSSHRFAGRASLRASELAGETIHMPSAGCVAEMRERATQLLRECGIEPRYDDIEGTDFSRLYDFDFTEGVFLAPISHVLYNMPASLLGTYHMVRLEGEETAIWHYAITAADPLPECKALVDELIRQVEGSDIKRFWNYLPTFK